MKIGIPKEVLNNEYRVSLTPAGTAELVKLGHEVFVQDGAGIGSTFTNEDYENHGAKIVSTAKEAWSADVVVKVKQPIKSEFEYLREDLVLFTYLHLAADKALAEELRKQKVTAIGYETVTNNDGELPLLKPMSEVAGRMSVQIAANLLTKKNNGSGVLLGGVPGVPKGKVTIIGGGTVGMNAATIAIGLGARVTIINRSVNRLKELEEIFGHRIQTLVSNEENIANSVQDSDVVIGAVLVPGAKAPTLVTREMVKSMQKGSVIVDVAIDQGGIFETIDRISSHDDPYYVEEGVLHYAVPNIPGAVSTTSTIALTNVTLPYLVSLVNNGIEKAFRLDLGFKNGLNVYKGYIANKSVANDLELEFKSFEDLK